MNLKKLQILIILIFVVFVGCKKSSEPLYNTFSCDSKNNQINFVFKYGYGSKNIINTFDCTFQKDLVIDPPVKINFKLEILEIDSIATKLAQIDVISYPDTFVAVVGDTVVGFSPHQTYYFYFERDSIQKSIYWRDSIANPDTSADRLRNFFNFIVDIIVSKPEYQSLPPAIGGYD